MTKAIIATVEVATTIPSMDGVAAVILSRANVTMLNTIARILYQRRT